MTEFGDHIRKARNQRNWTQGELAKRVNMQPLQIGHYEAGTRAPSASNLVAVADALSVTVDSLAGRPDADYDKGFRDGYFQCREDMKSATKLRIARAA